MLLQDIVRKNVKIVELVSPDAKELTQTEWTAVEDLAACRSSSAVKHLLRIIHIREPSLGDFMKLPNGTFVRGPSRGQALDRGLSARAGGLSNLSNRPAAEALVSIGLPSVEEIRMELERIRPKPIPSGTLRLYAKVLLNILTRDHVRRYIEEERTHAPKTAEAEYARLLALPEMNLKPQQWRRGASPKKARD
jgi:hypothetical protein